MPKAPCSPPPSSQSKLGLSSSSSATPINKVKKHSSKKILTRTEYKEHWNDDGITLEKHYFLLPNGKRQGPYKEFYENGKTLKIHSNYENGKLQGVYEVYYENGNLAVHSNYKNDNLHGECKYYGEEEDDEVEYFDEADLPFDTCYTYKDGNRHGEYIQTKKDGTLKMRCNYENDELQGDYEEHWEDGTIVVYTKC